MRSWLWCEETKESRKKFPSVRYKFGVALSGCHPHGLHTFSGMETMFRLLSSPRSFVLTLLVVGFLMISPMTMVEGRGGRGGRGGGISGGGDSSADAAHRSLIEIVLFSFVLYILSFCWWRNAQRERTPWVLLTSVALNTLYLSYHSFKCCLHR